MPAADRITIRAYAKINLTLEVVGRRADLYHELRSVVQTVDLADELELQPGRPGTLLRLSGYPVPSGDDNLIMAALRQADTRFGLSRDLEVRLLKRIPPGRGLGGGSSDAAAVLQALSCLYPGRLSPAQLLGLAAELGSDVPLFLHGGCQLMSGRGEQLQRLPEPHLDYSLVLAWPEVMVPTERAYQCLLPEDYTDGAATQDLWERLSAGGLPTPDLLLNSFERAVFAEWPQVAVLHERLSEFAGAPARLTGSGSGLYALCDHPDNVAHRLRALGYEAVAARPVPHGSELTCPDLGGEAPDG